MREEGWQSAGTGHRAGVPGGSPGQAWLWGSLGLSVSASSTGAPMGRRVWGGDLPGRPAACIPCCHSSSSVPALRNRGKVVADPQGAPTCTLPKLGVPKVGEAQQNTPETCLASHWPESRWLGPRPVGSALGLGRVPGDNPGLKKTIKNLKTTQKNQTRPGAGTLGWGS